MTDPRKSPRSRNPKTSRKPKRPAGPSRSAGGKSGRHAPAIDFEKAFLKGHRSYDTAVGDWWHGQASNGAHLKAYLHVAQSIRAQLARAGKGGGKGGKARRPWIVDYGCGSGRFLSILAALLPEARIVALDGSIRMLELARRRLESEGLDAGTVAPKAAFDPAGPRIRLVKTHLPNFSLPARRADAVAFLFPNLTPAPGDQPYYDRHGYKNRTDVKVARILARLREMDPEDEVPTPPPDELFDGLMTDRVISRHVRHLLKPGGLWFKVDYANANRDELSHLTRMRSFFSEGALREDVKDLRAETFFRYLRCDFRTSQVILDVYHQTKDPSDKTGGYFISSFKAE